MLASASTANAAAIAWTATVVDTTDLSPGPGTGLGDLAVSTSGILVEAINFGSTAADVTVNGVLFSGVITGNTTHYSSDLNGADGGIITGTTTGGDIDTLTATFARNVSDPTSSGTLTGMTIGHDYLVQFISSFSNLNRTMTFDDGNGNTIVQPLRNPHSFATGTFTADATTQTVNFTANTGSSFISGYQLRNITAIPEPSSTALLGLGGLALAMRRRRA